MKNELILVTDTVAIPKNTGLKGFLLAVEGALRSRPRIQRIEIDSHGKMSVSHYALESDGTTPIEIDFESVAPSASIRNAEVKEVVVHDSDDRPLLCINKLLLVAAQDRMYPIAFVTGAKSGLYDWIAEHTGMRYPAGTACGFPVLADRHIPDDTLILATSFGPGGSLVDTQLAYKLAMPPRNVVEANPDLKTVDPTSNPSVVGGV